MKIFYCIFGASGHGKVIVEILENLGHSIRELYDDDVNKKKLLGYNVTNDPYIFNLKGVNWIIGIGNNKVRKQIVENHLFYYGTAIDNSSQISKRAEIGPGTVIMPGVSVNASTII
jgi:acetyltransferase EpsM